MNDEFKKTLDEIEALTKAYTEKVECLGEKFEERLEALEAECRKLPTKAEEKAAYKKGFEELKNECKEELEAFITKEGFDIDAKIDELCEKVRPIATKMALEATEERIHVHGNWYLNIYFSKRYPGYRTGELACEHGPSIGLNPCKLSDFRK